MCIIYMSGFLSNVLFGVVVILILFAVTHFVNDIYITLYRMYYDSSYFTKISNSFKQAKAKYLPF